MVDVLSFVFMVDVLNFVFKVVFRNGQLSLEPNNVWKSQVP
jgi:hypothetical protein